MFKARTKKMNILFVASEASPFVKIGGLGEVLFSLPRALRALGHDARVMIPCYASIPQEKFPMSMHLKGLRVPNGKDENDIICNVKKFRDPNNDHAESYFLENQEYFEKRGRVYGYDDDAARWAVLCRGSLEFVRNNIGWTPDIIVDSDWQGGLIPNYLKTEYANDPILSKIATVFSIHNLYFQGMFDHRFTNDLEYDDGQSSVPAINDERLLRTNFMRRGIRYADVVNTVSQTYAQEITTAEYGELLENLLQERRSRLFGILNGIDYKVNDPETNPHVEFKYSRNEIEKRQKNKIYLQKKFNLEEDADIPVVAIVSRLSEQKGLDLIIDIMEPLLDNYQFQLIVLGGGDSKYLSFFGELEKKYDDQVATHLSFDGALPHVIYSGADIILVPSRFEPSGLTQMEAMRYGALPLVRKTGGLADSVEDYSPTEDKGTGFVFEKYDKYAFFGAMVRALETYKYKDKWQKMQKRAMLANFSWDKSAVEYVELFKKAMAFNSESREE